jgi:hypothetical protein
LTVRIALSSGAGFDVLLDGALQRPRAEHRVEAGLGQFGQRGVADLQLHVQLRQALLQVAELDLRDAGDVLLVEGVEHHHLVDAVDELGAEVGLHLAHHRQLDHLVIVAGHLLDHLAAEVAGHHDHGVLEVHGAALAVGHAAVVEHLQQHVEDVRVGLLDFVEAGSPSRACAAPLRSGSRLPRSRRSPAARRSGGRPSASP